MPRRAHGGTLRVEAPQIPRGSGASAMSGADAGKIAYGNCTGRYVAAADRRSSRDGILNVRFGRSAKGLHSGLRNAP